MPYHQRHNHHLRGRGRNISLHNGNRIERQHGNRTRYDGIDRHLIHAIDNYLIPEELNKYHTRSRRKYFEDSQDGTNDESDADDIMLEPFDENVRKRGKNILDLQELGEQAYEINGGARKIHHKENQRQYYADCDAAICDRGDTSGRYERLTRKKIGDTVNFSRNENPTTTRTNQCNLRNGYHEMINRDEDEMDTEHYPEDFDSQRATRAYRKAYESDSHNSRYNAQVEDQSDTTDHTGCRYTKRYLTREPTDATDNVQRSHYTVSTPEPSDRRPSRNRNYSWKYPGNEYVTEKSYNKPIPLSMISPIQHIKSDARHASTYDVNYLDRRNDREPRQNSQAEIEQKVTYQKMPIKTRSKHHEMRYDFEHRSNVYHSRNMDNGPKLVTRARSRYLTPGSNLVSHTTMSNDIHRELSNKKTTRKLSSQVKIDPDVSDGHIVTTRTRNSELVSNTSDGKFRMPLSKEKIHSKDSNGIKNLRQLKKCVNIEMHEKQHKDEIRAIRKQAHRKTDKKASVPKALRRIIIQKVKILLACVENDNIFSTEAFNAEFENLTAQVLKLKLLQKDEKRSKSTSTLDRDEFFSGSLTKTGERKQAKTKGTSNESKYRTKQFDEMDEQGSCDNKIKGSHLKLMSDEDNNVIWNITRTDEVQVKDINNNAAIADKLNCDEQKAIVSHAGKKEKGVSRKAAFDVKYDEIIQLFNHTKVLLMSPELDGKMTGVHQFHAIVKAVHDESRLIQLILNENILSFLSIEAILSSENCTKEFCQSMNIISGHSCFYSNNVAKEVLENMVRVLDVCLDDRSQNGKVPLLFGTLAQVILNSNIEPLTSTLDRTKIFMLIQKVHNLIGLTRLDLHIQSIQIISRIVKEFKTVDDKLTRMLSNIKEITNGILMKEINGNVAKSINANFRTYMIENSKLLEECLDLYAICGVEAENVKQCDDEINKRNESLLFLSDVDNNGTNEKLQMESEDCEMYISADHSIDMKQLLETIFDNFKKNIMHDELIINPNDFEYWASALRIVCVLMKYNDLRELKIYKTLYSLYSIQQNAISKGIRDEIYKDYLLVVAEFWKTIADKVFQCNAVNKLLDENIGTLMTIPHKLWVRTLFNDFYELKLKFTILVLVYIFNCFRIEFDIFRYGDSVFQNIINEADLPRYVVKVMLFLACMKNKVSLIKSLTLPIERCSVFAEVDTEYDYCDCLLKNWNHYESYRFKWFVVEKYLSLNMGHTRKKRFERFVLSNEKLMVFLINIMLLIPLNKNTLDQIGSILRSKIKRDKDNNIIVDDLWNSLNHILKNHHTAFHNNLQYFLELCLIRTPSMLKFNFPIDDSNIANKEKMNQLVILSDLLTKYLIKIEIQKDNLVFLLQMMLFVILNSTKNMNNRRIIECNTKSKIPDIATKTAVLLSDNKDVRASSFNHLYLTFTNILVDLCQKHEIPLHINFNYTYLIKQIINRDIILMEQLLKLLRTLFLNLVKVNPLLRHTIKNFQNIFIGTDFLFELVYTFLLNSLSLHESHSDLILAILIIMLQLKGHVVYNNPFNYTIVKTISREKSYSQFFLRFVNALFNLFLENFAESSRCLGKPRRVKIVEIIGCNMNYLSQQFDGSPVLNQLEEKLSRLSITCEDTNSGG